MNRMEILNDTVRVGIIVSVILLASVISALSELVVAAFRGLATGSGSPLNAFLKCLPRINLHLRCQLDLLEWRAGCGLRRVQHSYIQQGVSSHSWSVYASGVKGQVQQFGTR
jgi:hypothetical protein